MAGIPEIHAMITPTTRGFRKLLDDEGQDEKSICNHNFFLKSYRLSRVWFLGITYAMPLKKRKSVGENKNNLESITINENEELSGDEDWLESLEVDAQQIKILTKSQVIVNAFRF